MRLHRIVPIVLIILLIIPGFTVAYEPGRIEILFLQRLPRLDDCLDEITKVALEDEQYMKYVEEEHLRQRDSLKVNPIYLFKNPFNTYTNNLNNSNIEIQTIEPQPLPTGRVLHVGGTGPDNYTRIQEAIGHSNDGDTVFIHNESSPYYECINVIRAIQLIGEDRSTTVIDGNYKGDVVTLYDSYTSISELTIRRGVYDIITDGCNNIKINNNIITDCEWDGIYFKNCHDIIINNNSFKGCTVDVIILYNSSDNTITYNKIYKTNLDGINVDGSNNNISNNLIWESGSNGISLTGSDSNIANNIIMGSTEGIFLGGLNTNQLIINNTISGSRLYGIEMIHAYENTFCNNIIRTCASRGIVIDDGNKNTFIFNTIKENENFGIFIKKGNDNIIISNNITDQESDGIWIMEGNGNIIENNTISKNSINGIRISDSNNKIINNTIANNKKAGMEVFSGGNIIKDNYFLRDGLLINAAGNFIINNTINGKPIIYLEDESNKIIDKGDEKGQIILVICHNITICNQKIYNTYIGIQLQSSDACLIINNTLGNNGNGIFLAKANQNTITNNNLANNDYGIFLNSLSENNTICNNNITNNKFAGINLYFSTKNLISDNFCISNLYDGIGLMGLSSNNIVENNFCENNMKGIAIRNSFNNKILKNRCIENQQGILLNNAYLNSIIENRCSYNSIAIYLFKSRLNSISNNNCNHSDFDGFVLEQSGFNILTNNTAGPYNYIGIVLQSSTSNSLSYNDVFQNVGYGVTFMKTRRNQLHNNNIYNNGEHELVGLFCIDNARKNYWGGGTPNKLVLGWIGLFPWLNTPVEFLTGDISHKDVTKDLAISQEIRKREFL